MTTQESVSLKDVAGHVPVLLAPAVEAAAYNAGNIEIAANEIAERVSRGAKLFGFGAGHAYAFAAEFCSRAGGLPFWTSMNLEDLRTEPRPAHKQLSDSADERDPALGVALAEFYEVGPGDVLVIASQSGRNGASVEMATWARKRGIYVIGVLSSAQSAAYSSRHPSGLKLGDVCDLNLDLRTPSGDATLVSTNGKRVCAASTIAFALLAQLLNARVALALEERGIDLQVITSANVDVTA